MAELEEKVEGLGVEAVEKYGDLDAGVTNGVEELHQTMRKFRDENDGKSFTEEFMDLSIQQAKGELKGSLSGLQTLMKRWSPELKSTEVKLGEGAGLSDEKMRERLSGLGVNISDEGELED